MKRDTKNPPAKSRAPKKPPVPSAPAVPAAPVAPAPPAASAAPVVPAAPVASAAPVVPAAPVASAAPANTGNVGSIESALSLAAGVLLVVGALFPRSLKQLFLLGFGGAMIHRGMKSTCYLYKALGIDSAHGSLLAQINDKYLTARPGAKAEL